MAGMMMRIGDRPWPTGSGVVARMGVGVGLGLGGLGLGLGLGVEVGKGVFVEDMVGARGIEVNAGCAGVRAGVGRGA